MIFPENSSVMSTATDLESEPLLGRARPRRTGFFHARMLFPVKQQQQSLVEHWRSYTRAFLVSKWGHYLVLLLVSLDVACIFADFLIELHVCEATQHSSHVDQKWGVARDALGIVSLTFSSLFMLELVLSIVSFGFSYFASKFHIFDSVVIVAAFAIDVALHGTDEELGSIVVVLRLWRVFKIIEELSSAGEDTLEEYQEQIEKLREENSGLRRRLNMPLGDGNEQSEPQHPEST